MKRSQCDGDIGENYYADKGSFAESVIEGECDECTIIVFCADIYPLGMNGYLAAVRNCIETHKHARMNQ